MSTITSPNRIDFLFLWLEWKNFSLELYVFDPLIVLILANPKLITDSIF